MQFLLINLLSLCIKCIKLINSVVFVGMSFGFLTAISIGPSYLLLLRAQIREKEIEKRSAAVSGVIMGQLIMQISIYYRPLHLVLGKPHIITLLAIPYFCLRFFHNLNLLENPTSNIPTGKRSIYYFISIYKCTLYYIFWNNLILQFFNHYIYPNSTLFRLVNIYLFRYNNKVLFLVSSFFGWLIGHILFVKCLESQLDRIRKKKMSFIRTTLLIQSDVRNLVSELKYRYLRSELRTHMDPIFRIMRLVLVWIWENLLIRLIGLIRSNKSLIREWRYLVSDFWSIVLEVKSILRVHETFFSFLFFFIAGQYLAKMPLPILTNAMYQAAISQKIRDKERKERLKNSELYENDENELDEEDENEIYEEDETKIYEKREKDKEDPYPSKTKKFLWFDEGNFLKTTHLYDIYQWNRPVRYINKKKKGGRAVRNEMSQYFFYPCQNDGKQRISFTYPPSFSIFWEKIQANRSLETITKFSCDELNDYDYWISTNEEKRNRLSTEFRNRIEVLDLDNESLYWNVLEKKNRLGKSVENETQFQEIYLEKEDDPLFKGPHRVRVRTRDESLFTNTQSTNDNKSNEKSTSSFVRKKERISKEVLKWKYILYDEIEEVDELYNKERTVVHEIRSRKFFTIVYYNIYAKNNMFTALGIDEEIPFPDGTLLYFSISDNYRRELIHGTMRSQRRKVNLYNVYQIYPQSPLFLNRTWSWYQEFRSLCENLYSLYRRLIEPFFIKKKFLILNATEKETKHEEKKEKKKEKERKETKREKPILNWMEIELDKRKKAEEDEEREEQKIDEIIFSVHPFRSCVLLIQSYLRKNLYLPFLIRIKNGIRLLLGQSSEWSEDKEDLAREIHILCTHSGFEHSEKELPRSWLIEGMQIKILFPFRLRPWRDKSNLNLQDENPKENFCFLTIFGTETYFPYGPRFINRPPLFRPIFKELKKRIRKKWVGIFKRRSKLFPNLYKKTKKWLITNFTFIKILIEKITNRKIYGYKILSKLITGIEENSVIELIENYEVAENQLVEFRENQGVAENRLVEFRENQFKNLTDKTSTIINEIEGILTKKKTKARTQSIKLNIKRKGVRLIRKSHYLFQFFTERINIDICLSIINTFFRKKKYIDIFFYIINLIKINTQAFLELKKKIIDGYTYIYDEYFYNTKRHQKITQEKEKIKKINKETIQFIWNIKESLLFITELNKFLLKNIQKNIKITKNSKIFYDFSFLSQAYVFYKLSQTKVPNFYKLRSVLQYHGILFVFNNDKEIKDYFRKQGISFFLKKEIKDYFRKQGIIQSQLKDKKYQNSIVQQWKNWLKSNYQHNLSSLEWSILAPQKWRNSLTQHCRVKNSQLSKGVSYKNKKDRLIHYKKQKDSENYVLLKNKNENFKKTYRYDLLASKSIYYEEKKNSYTSSSLTKNQEFYYIYNYSKKQKPKSIDMCEGILITNYLGIGKDDIIDGDKNRDRKFFNFGILTFDLPIHQMRMKKTVYDWLVMNEKILKGPKSNLKLWFFPEFVFFSNTYKKKAWAIKKDFLFENENLILIENEQNENKEEKRRQTKMTKSTINVIRKHQDGSEKGKNDIDKDSYIYLYNKGENEEIRRFRKRTTINTLERKYFNVQYSFHNFFEVEKYADPMNEDLLYNLKIAAFLAKSTNKKPRNLVLDTLKNQHLNLHIMINFNLKKSSSLKTEKDLSLTNEKSSNIKKKNESARILQNDSSLLAKGILIAEPFRTSITDNGKLIMYQTLSLVPKSKKRHNQHKEIFDLKSFDESLATYQKMMKNIEKNHYDLLSPENILSPRRRRELRILICFNSKNCNDVDKNTIFLNMNKGQIKNCSQLFTENEGLDKLIKLKLFLWPYYRLEDLACMNRYWFDTANGSRFSMLRIYLYPRL
uniref:Protein TIC 214 n=1 Tax=Drosera regia TaxID=4371 RepID=A0A1Z2RQW9_DRORE|nr:component of inner membrane protein import complex [Drosera regia]ASA46215.1 component of inner membrane protein import complex [Drosera regia]